MSVFKVLLSIAAGVAMNYVAIIGLQFYNWGYSFGIPNIVTLANLIAVLTAAAVYTAGARRPRTELAMVRQGGTVAFTEVPTGRAVEGKTLHRCAHCSNPYVQPAVLEDYLKGTKEPVCPYCFKPVKPVEPGAGG